MKANGHANDRIAIIAQGSGQGLISVSGSAVSYSGVVIGTFTGGNGTTPLVVTFNSQASLLAVQALARRIGFRSTLASPPTLTRSVEWKLTDHVGGGVAVATESITVSL